MARVYGCGTGDQSESLQPTSEDENRVNSNSVYAVCEDKEERKWSGQGAPKYYRPHLPLKKYYHQ